MSGYVVRRVVNSLLDWATLCSVTGLQLQWSLMEAVHVWGTTDSCSGTVVFSFAFMVTHLPEIGTPNSGRR